MYEIKPGYGDNRGVLATMIPLKTPLSVIITPSTRCQLKCKYCPQSLPTPILSKSGFIREDMQRWMFVKIVNQLSEFDTKLKAMHFQGMGEPLMNESVAWMVWMAGAVTERTNLITNGILLSNEMSMALIDAGLNTIKISLQGMRDLPQIRFRKMVDNIRFFYEHKKECEVYVKVIDTGLKKSEEEKFIKIFGPIADRVFIEKACPMQEGIAPTKSTTNMYGQKRVRYEVCSLGFYMMYITPKGDVFPCCNYFDPASWGNLNDRPLKEIWNGVERTLFLRMMLEKGRSKYAWCKNCNSPESCLRPEEYLDNHVKELQERFK